MTAPTARASREPSDERAELAELRRRAYGPDADIAGDPEAVERLRRLEERAAGIGATQDAPPEPPTPVPSPAAVAAPAATAAPVPAPDPVAIRATEAGPRWKHPWSRRGVALVVTAALAAFGAGAAVTLLTRERPALVLSAHGVPDGDEAIGLAGFARGAVGSASEGSVEARTHDRLGAIEVTSLRSPTTSCLVLGRDGAALLATCGAADGFALTLDLTVSAEGVGVRTTGQVVNTAQDVAFTGADAGVADGTRLRFVLGEDEVEVWSGTPLGEGR